MSRGDAFRFCTVATLGQSRVCDPQHPAVTVQAYRGSDRGYWFRTGPSAFSRRSHSRRGLREVRRTHPRMTAESKSNATRTVNPNNDPQPTGPGEGRARVPPTRVWAEGRYIYTWMDIHVAKLTGSADRHPSPWSSRRQPLTGALQPLHWRPNALSQGLNSVP